MLGLVDWPCASAQARETACQKRKSHGFSYHLCSLSLICSGRLACQRGLTIALDQSGTLKHVRLWRWSQPVDQPI